VKQSDYHALLFYEAAVEAGDPSAMFTLGNWVYAGRQCTKDLVRAHNLQLSAASYGHPAAMYNVGCNFMSGQGVERDLKQAAEWFEKSAATGFLHAAINLGGMYRDGFGVTKDLRKARDIFSSFADKNEICRESVDQIDAELNSSKTNI
jgi:TPR repeat protein